MNSEDDERDWGELKRLGGAAHCSQRYADAAEYYRQSIEMLEAILDHDAGIETHELMTDKAKLHANRGASLMMLMQITEAQKECRRSIEVDATYARAYLRLGRIQVMLGDTANAQANIDTAKHLMTGNDHGEGISNDQADHASLVKMEATIKKLVTLQGEIKWYVDCGDFKQALVHTKNALALAPSCRDLQAQKVRILLHQKEFDQIAEFCVAIVHKQQAMYPKPANRGGLNTQSLKEKTVDEIKLVGIDLGLLWATSLHYQNRVEDAIRIVNALEVVAPCSSHVIQLKRQWQDMKQLKHNGNEHFKQGNYQEAVRFYSEAVQIDVQHQEYCAIIYCNRAAAQMGLERYHTAILDCNEALQRKPKYPRALLRRARCHVALEMYHEAVKDFDRYLSEHPADSSSDMADDAATIDQIKKAYRKLALVYHPDKAKTSTHAELFKEMTAAYNVLSDESARSKYDRELIYNRVYGFTGCEALGHGTRVSAGFDNHDEAALVAMVKQTKVVISLVGPYALYGELLVKVCADNGVHYCDLTGEMLWVKKMEHKYQQSAVESGAVLANSCGVDSVPSDLVAYLLTTRIHKLYGKDTKTGKIDFLITDFAGSVSGGTLASVFQMVEGKTRKQLADTCNPYILTDEDNMMHKQDEGMVDANTINIAVRYDEVMGLWTSVFLGQLMNQAVVHRSNFLLNN
ncbi:hypothetical protein BBJ29_008633, partial [Phytophthora kernoviae]